MAGPSDWRDTALPARFLTVDATACIPFFAVFYHPSWGTLGGAVVCFVALGALAALGWSPRVLWRRMRSRIAGRRKSGVAWWHRPQRDLYPYKRRQ